MTAAKFLKQISSLLTYHSDVNTACIRSFSTKHGQTWAGDPYRVMVCGEAKREYFPTEYEVEKIIDARVDPESRVRQFQDSGASEY